MESTYTDIIERLNSKIEWHRNQIDKLTNMVIELSDESEYEVTPEDVTKTSDVTEKRTTKKTTGNGQIQWGERKEQIIELLDTTDKSIREIAEELGTHPNYVRLVKKAWENSLETSKPRRVVTRTSK